MKVLAITFLTLFSTFTFAKDCSETAIRVAKESVRNASVASLTELPAGRSYLEKYEVSLRSKLDPEVLETVTVTMMKSDCTVVSVIPEI